jgi:hypothetical protein
MSASCQETLLNPVGVANRQRPTDLPMQLTHVIAASIGAALLLALATAVRSRRQRDRDRRRREIDDLRGRDA